MAFYTTYLGICTICYNKPMQPDKFAATWLSYSSTGDFLKCPKLYYLRNVYKDPLTGHKITRIEPALTLGQIVHDVLDELSVLPSTERTSYPFIERYKELWTPVSGKRGGFKTKEDEEIYFERGKRMLLRVKENIEPLLSKAVKIKSDDGLPWLWLSQEENLILCGKIDWLIYKEGSDSVHILDFKTGKYKEKEESLQLPIYMILASTLQNRPISGASYWYLESENNPEDVDLPDVNESREAVLQIGRRIKLARQLEHFTCKSGDVCKHCAPLSAIKAGQGEKVGVSNYNQDLYLL